MIQRDPNDSPHAAAGAPRFPARLTRAINTGDLPALEAMYRTHGRTLVYARRRDGWTCLHLAARANQPEILAWLLERGADPVQWNTDPPIEPESPLAEALRAGHREAAEVLLPVTHGVPRHGVISDAIRRQHDAMAAWLVRRFFTGADTPYAYSASDAILSDCPEALQALIERGLSLPSRDAPGGAPLLHTAAARDRVECLRRLIDAGAHLNAAEKWHGDTPLHKAARAPAPGAAAVLLGAGADPEIRNREGCTALDVAREQTASPTRDRVIALLQQVQLTRDGAGKGAREPTGRPAPGAGNEGPTL